jgi:hypothetical protein
VEKTSSGTCRELAKTITAPNTAIKMRAATCRGMKEQRFGGGNFGQETLEHQCISKHWEGSMMQK